MSDFFKQVFDLRGLVQKTLFWLITVVAGSIAFLGISYVNNKWATPYYVEQKVEQSYIGLQSQFQDSINKERTERLEYQRESLSTLKSISDKVDVLVLQNARQEPVFEYISKEMERSSVKIDRLEGRLREIEAKK